MYSLNVPVPASVARLALDCASHLPDARPRQRGEHTLVCKRLGTDDADYYPLEARAREALAGTLAFVARVTGLGQFAEAASGSSPVVYLAVESPELERLHATLCASFDPVPGVEGENYVPHVTVARGGSADAIDAVPAVDPVEWTVTELAFRDARRGQTVSTVSLPA